jgi:hypothetical protein
VRKAFIVIPIGLLMVLSACVTGDATFACTVQLPVWPTTAGPPVTCSGSAQGAVSGTMDGGGAYALVAPNSRFVANASGYSERCTFNEPLNGFASGTTSISGLVGTPSGATAVGSFVWTRIGVTAVVLLPKGGKIFFNNGRTATQIANANATAAFAPTNPVTGRTCSAPGPLTALITGHVQWYL